MDYVKLRATALEQWQQEVEMASACLTRLDALASLIRSADAVLKAKPVTALSVKPLVNKTINLRNRLKREG